MSNKGYETCLHDRERAGSGQCVDGCLTASLLSNAAIFCHGVEINTDCKPPRSEVSAAKVQHEREHFTFSF